MKTPLKLLLLSLTLLHSLAFAKSVSNEELATWEFVGEGFVAVDKKNKHVVFGETPASKGVMLVSPKSYAKNLVLRYKIHPLSFESVQVTMLAVNNKDGASLSFPKDYNANMAYLVQNTKSYFFAYHNKAHKKSPFVRKYPQALPGKQALFSAPKNVMSTKWYDVEIRKENGTLTLKVNKKVIVQAKDEAMLEEGKVIFRMRGTKTRVAHAFIKDVHIQSLE